MDWLVWLSVILALSGAGMFAFGMRRDPILAVAIPTGMALLIAVLLLLIYSSKPPIPSSASQKASANTSPNHQVET